MSTRKPKKNDPDEKKVDRHKPARMCRIRTRLAEQVDLAAGLLEQDFTQWVNDAVRMRLEQAGQWPPAGEK